MTNSLSGEAAGPELNPAPRRAIIIGASSGIGEALARDLAASGYELGLVSRRFQPLQTLADSVSTHCQVKVIDITDHRSANSLLSQLINELGDTELFIICAGTGHLNPQLDWQPELNTIETNVLGFAAMANIATRYLEQRGSGQLVGISSISAIRGDGRAPAYGASKAFVSSYLSALRHRFAKAGLPIDVIDIQPGFVDTPMAQGEGLFWVAPVQHASAQILKAIQKRRQHAYVTRRWRLIAWALKLLPNWLYHRL